MNETHNKPNFWIGALVGGLLTAPLIVIFALAAQLVGTPFVPFDVFDWTSRVLPGPLIEFGIGTMVKTINALNLGETSRTAKLAEQSLAILGMMITGIVVGAILFEVLRRNRIRLLVGDRVTVEMSPYDLSKGRINYRHKDERAPATPVTRSGGPPRRR